MRWGGRCVGGLVCSGWSHLPVEDVLTVSGGKPTSSPVQTNFQLPEGAALQPERQDDLFVVGRLIDTR